MVLVFGLAVIPWLLMLAMLMNTSHWLVVERVSNSLFVRECRWGG